MFDLAREEAREHVLASIDSALTAFGDSVRVVVYYELERAFGVSRKEIILKPEKFDETLNNIFGVGSQVLRKTILNKLEESSMIKHLASQDLSTAIRTVYHDQLEKLG